MISNFPILLQYKYPHAHVAFITARISILNNGFSFRGELYAMQAGIGCFLPIHTNKDEKIQIKMKTHRIPRINIAFLPVATQHLAPSKAADRT